MNRNFCVALTRTVLQHEVKNLPDEKQVSDFVKISLYIHLNLLLNYTNNCYKMQLYQKKVVY